MKRTRIAVGFLAALAATLLISSSALASRGGWHHPQEQKPTVVLVHGAWADSGSWDQVVRRLQGDGYTVWAPPNPMRGVATDSETVADFIHTISGPIVLVGHSYGGMVITNAATGDSQVKALVYVDAYIPEQEQTLVGLTGEGSCFATELDKVFNFVPFPGAPTEVADAYVKQEVFPGCFANGLPAREAAALAATQRPLATNALIEQSGPPAWKTIPSWDVLGTADRVIPAASQLAMAHNAHAHITQIRAPHLSMISDPDVVTSVIEQAARATAGQPSPHYSHS